MCITACHDFQFRLDFSQKTYPKPPSSQPNANPAAFHQSVIQQSAKDHRSEPSQNYSTCISTQSP